MKRMATAVHLPYRYLGKSGLKVSSLCLGAMTFGQQEVKRRRTTHRWGVTLADRSWRMDTIAASAQRGTICADVGR